MDVFSTEEISLPKPNYQYITKGEDVPRILDEISKYPVIEVDTETTGLDPYSSKPVLIQIGVQNKAFVFDIRHDTEHSSINLDMFKPVLTGNKQLRLLQNALFDMKMIKVHGGFYLENVYDTLIVEQLFCLGLPRRNSLDIIVKRYLGLDMAKEPRGTFIDYNQVFKPFQLEYAANDVVVLELIRQMQASKIKQEGFENVCRLEFEFLKPMCEMELNGITIDVDKWHKILETIDADKEATSKIVSEMLGASVAQNTLFGVSLINIDSNKQLKTALNKLGLNLDKTDVGSLSKYKGVPVIDALLDYRKAQKFVSTYGETLLARINKETGRLHTSFKQMVSTGRMSSSDPNLQNIPKKQKYRSCFVAKPGYKLITADMSGAELRILGNLSQDPVFIDCFNNGIDLHSKSASEIYNVDIDKVDKSMRDACKAISFGLCIDEDSNLITNRGIIKIKNVSIGDVVAHDTGSDTIIDKKNTGTKEVFKITSQFGYEFRGTEFHKIMVIDSNGDYVEKKISDVNIKNDQICIKAGSNIFPEDIYCFDEFSIEKKTNYKHFNLPTHLTKEWAAFLGLFISEGSLSKVKNRDKYSIIQFGFSKTASSEFINKIDVLFLELFGDRFNRLSDDTKVYFTINSVLIGEWLYGLFNYTEKLKTESVFVPECIKCSPREIQVEFLRWIMEGDGTIKKNGNTIKIQYSSKSIELIRDLQIIFLNFGIVSSILKEGRKDYPGEVYYVLDIISNNCRYLFIKDIGFVTDYKNKKHTINSECYESSYKLNNQHSKLEGMLVNIPDDLKSNRLYYDSIYNCINYTGGGIGNVCIDRLYKLDPFLTFIHDNKIIPLKIKTIEKVGSRNVYDVSVANRELLLVDGFVVHNCYGLSKYGLSRRLNITEDAAESLIDKYFNVFKGVHGFLDESDQKAVMNRYTRTVSGRKRFYRIPDWDDPEKKNKIRAIGRQGKNAGIQGANADTIKEAMILCVDRLEKGNHDAKLLLTVHDEIIVEARDDQVKEVSDIMSASLIDGFDKYFTKIPMETNPLVGPCWLKGECEKCKSSEMKFIPDKKYGTKLVCSNCNEAQE